MSLETKSVFRLPDNLLSNSDNLVNEIMGVKFSPPKYKIGQIVRHYEGSYDDIFDEKGVVIGYVLMLEDSTLEYRNKRKNEWEYSLFYLRDEMIGEAWEDNLSLLS